MNWWNSAESVDRIAQWVNWCVAIFGFLAAAAAVAAVVLGMRSGELKAEVDRDKDTQAQRLRTRVEEAEAAAADLRANLDEAQRTQRESDKRLAELGQTATAANEAAARAHAELQKHAPRRLTTEQRQKLLSAIRHVSRPDGVFLISTISTDVEASEFASQIKSVLDEAGWRTRLEQGIYDRQPEYGTTVEIQDPAVNPPYAASLHRALLAAGIPAEFILNRNQNPGAVRLFVGHRMRP